ncbi:MULTISPECIES: phosphopantetheine-binding protein [Pseudomonas]|jgi:acyl carrier protein|uniref:phosphopantetheine-binding protein n=1 Tax=Pseudomonas TaxID=286 RepID=UPI00211546F0|nr:MULTISPECIES: phosphopantetheine-binding protein [Pseudomonas]UVL36056.1 phosphopantetheine-binding protein [Pseudomonas sp. B21-041]WPN76000.1 phosphopantetheine-binding protein [Pseudomonas germanica]
MKSEVLEMDDVEQQVRKFVADYFEINEDQVKNESSFVGDLGLDDVDKLYLMMVIVNEFGMEIPEYESMAFTTVQDVINYLREENVNDQ